LTPKELDLTFWVPNYGAQFHQNRVRIAAIGGWTDRQTDVTDVGNFIIRDVNETRETRDSKKFLGIEH